MDSTVIPYKYRPAAVLACTGLCTGSANEQASDLWDMFEYVQSRELLLGQRHCVSGDADLQGDGEASINAGRHAAKKDHDFCPIVKRHRDTKISKWGLLLNIRNSITSLWLSDGSLMD